MLKDRLKSIRLEKGLTQKQVAEIIGISYQNYQQWERGVRNPKESTLRAIAKALDVPVDYLAGRTYHLDLSPYNPSQNDMEAIKLLIDNYFKNRE